MSNIAQAELDTLLRQPAAALRPTVLDGLCSDWPAMQWSAETLRARVGHKPVPYGGEMLPLAAALDHIEASTEAKPAKYLYACHLRTHLPELLPDVTPLPGARLNRLHSPLFRKDFYYGALPELLLAGPGTRFPVLHIDFYYLHTIITQVRGDKEFIFYANDQTPWLYPKPDNAFCSAIEGFDPVDLERWPLFAKATPLKVLVKEGQSIFLPSGWWHRTRILDRVSIAVTWDLVTKANWRNYHETCHLADLAPGSLKRGLKGFIYPDLRGAALSASERFSRPGAPA
jgi:hypothetical protein